MSDLIDRQAAIDAPVKMVSEGIEWIPVYHLKSLPSAQPELTQNLHNACTDLISRQEVIKLLDEVWVDGHEYQGWLHDEVNRLPSAQPEIVYCKDCKHWDTSWENNFAPNYHYCPLIDGIRSGDFYCADAERRTDEQTD